eukprot:1774660-Rhodomonas_salina.1
MAPPGGGGGGGAGVPSSNVSQLCAKRRILIAVRVLKGGVYLHMTVLKYAYLDSDTRTAVCVSREL